MKELEVLRLIAEGHSSATVAVILGYSVHTVRNWHDAAFVKLGAYNRTHAVALAIRSGQLL